MVIGPLPRTGSVTERVNMRSYLDSQFDASAKSALTEGIEVDQKSHLEE